MNESSKIPNGRETIRLECQTTNMHYLLSLEDMKNLEDVGPDKSLPFLLHPAPDNQPTQEFLSKKITMYLRKRKNIHHNT